MISRRTIETMGIVVALVALVYGAAHIFERIYGVAETRARIESSKAYIKAHSGDCKVESIRHDNDAYACLNLIEDELAWRSTVEAFSDYRSMGTGVKRAYGMAKSLDLKNEPAPK